MYLPIYLAIFVSIYLSVCLSTCVPIYLSISKFLNLSTTDILDQTILCVCVCMCMYVHVCARMCMYVYGEGAVLGTVTAKYVSRYRQLFWGEGGTESLLGKNH